jgi:DnaK suppressor protein
MTDLTASQRQDLVERLAERRQTLRAEVQRELANSDDPRVIGFKNELAATDDWVLADILADLDIAMVTRDIAELSEVEAALVRVDDGRYGICSDCGEPIGWPRLNVQPAAARCIACQEKLERRTGRPGHPTL